jgi:hypothetical protein
MSRPGAPAGAAFDAETVMSLGSVVERLRIPMMVMGYSDRIVMGVSGT